MWSLQIEKLKSKEAKSTFLKNNLELALRKSPTGRTQKEKLRMSKLLLSADEGKKLEIAASKIISYA